MNRRLHSSRAMPATPANARDAVCPSKLFCGSPHGRSGAGEGLVPLGLAVQRSIPEPSRRPAGSMVMVICLLAVEADCRRSRTAILGSWLPGAGRPAWRWMAGWLLYEAFAVLLSSHLRNTESLHVTAAYVCHVLSCLALLWPAHRTPGKQTHLSQLVAYLCLPRHSLASEWLQHQTKHPAVLRSVLRPRPVESIHPVYGSPRG